MDTIHRNRGVLYEVYGCQNDPAGHLPGIIIELKFLDEKVAEDRVDAELEKSAQEALDQIEKKQYAAAMRQEGISECVLGIHG